MLDNGSIFYVGCPTTRPGMLQGLALLSYPLPHAHFPRLPIRCSSSSPSALPESLASVAACGDLSARERRQLRYKKRERNAEVSGKWREEVEERLALLRRKDYSSWKEKLNLDNLAKLGPRWWTVRVRRVNVQETADRLARALARGFPEMEFKVYYPVVREKRRLKSGSYSEKMNPLFPGCVFIKCVLTKEVHDYIRECDGVGGFVGSMVGNTKRQINKPKPVAAEDMEKIFQQAKELQQNLDRLFEREQQDHNFNSNLDFSTPMSMKATKIESLAPGTIIRILSGPFAEFTGRVKHLDYTNKTATVGFTLFGKESSINLEFEQIAAETNDNSLNLSDANGFRGKS